MRRVRASDPNRQTKPGPQPVQVQRAKPAAWRAALELAGGDWRRLSIEPDGSVIVHNNPVRGGRHE